MPPPPPPARQWHIAANGETSGPFAEAELVQMAQSGRFGHASLVWTPGQDGWKPASEVATLAPLLAKVPPPPPGR
jgi:hypothetical protein